MRAVLSIGSNLGDSAALLRTVAEHFGGELVGASHLYSTPPWGVEDQPDFLNAVLVVDVEGTPEALLARCQELEQQAQRVREQRWGPRTLDVDIVQIRCAGEELLSKDPRLTLPHPRAHLRAFVLEPWFEVEPEATLRAKPLAVWLESVDCSDIRKVEPL
ncbi:2-amino-4-hydroxy-6-hydroxymethyldihydropteridine diphosphokinase [Corynebacterium gerontici]|uniref:2-amino-4-hydroxy-6-hydroxymethyldihydropteridine diphosphokinase n=1 Tax=Corynebacterium gerontici TaxID=2079234 RepID=A0A3G6IYB8_9CORY|nr:2-amino-4-hydroxy-6-hydroxymethyldihydropteridine diphosphokinase [Corynebacterium gerontici]AZA10657.1 2-amino-4-hydroxy-6-hydroxymethyldihydropteridine pyrophosphokinase [Corynebacterium gerontici]